MSLELKDCMNHSIRIIIPLLSELINRGVLVVVFVCLFSPRRNKVEISLIRSVMEDASKFASSKIIQKS